MTLFGIGAKAPLTLGAAMQALVGQATITTEQAQAANKELEAAGITDGQLITKAAFTDLSEKAGRVDAAEATAKGFTDALAAAGAADMPALVAQRDGYKVKADKFDKLPGASHSAPTLEVGKSDVEAQEPDAHERAISNLGHNKALDNHPLFGSLGRKKD